MAVGLVCLLTLGSSVFAAEGGPSYAGRLRSPTFGDDFRVPRSVHADLHTGEVFVCDTYNNRLVIFDADGLFSYQIEGGSVFRAPTDVAVDPDGYIFVLANHRGARRIVQLDFDGRLIGPVVISDVPADLPEPRPTSLALSTTGERLFLLDSFNNRLWFVTREGRVLATVDLAAGLTEDEALEQVLGHVDSYGDRVLVAVPTYGLVLLFDLSGKALGKIGLKGTAACKTAFPVAAALDSAERVVVLDKQRALFTVWEAESNKCLSEHSGFGNAPGFLYQPADLALDGEGRIYVSQGFEGRVQIFEGVLPALGAPERGDPAMK